MPTMKTIAAEAGVSVMTVSLALRNHPRISKATRQRVQEVAARLQYRSNPMVASLMTHIRSSRPLAYQANLAFLAENLQGIVAHPLFHSAYEGILKRAEELGFLVDGFSLGEQGRHHGRLKKILEARNIQGIILAPLNEQGPLDGLDCSQWSVVALGNSVLSPRFHRVTHHQFHGMQLILENLVRRGYRRIGLAIEAGVDDKVDRSWSSCMAGYHLRIPPRQRVPILLANLNSPALPQWLEKYRPDVVIGHNGLEWHLRQMDIRVPGDISFACLSVFQNNERGYSGLDQNWRLVGAAAVESVVAHIYRNERGIPASPKTVMLEGFWVDGVTAPGPTRASRVSKPR